MKYAFFVCLVVVFLFLLWGVVVFQSFKAMPHGTAKASMHLRIQKALSEMTKIMLAVFTSKFIRLCVLGLCAQYALKVLWYGGPPREPRGI